MSPRLFAVLCLTPGCLFANGGGYNTGVASTAAFQPIGVDQVEMVSERLEIDLHIEYADIRIEYVFHNPGKRVKVEAGFPAAIDVPATIISDEEPSLLPTPGLSGFQVKIDGKEIRHEVRGDELTLKSPSFFFSRKVTSWHIVNLSFSEGATRTVQVSYRNPYHCQVVTVSEDASHSARSLTYLFSAAGLWAEPIRQGTVILKCAGVERSEVTLSHPKRFVPSENGWTWDFHDFEPTLEDDLVVTLGRKESHYPYSWDGGRGLYYRAVGGKWSERGFEGGEWELRSRVCEAQASSTLPQDEGGNYEAANLFDGDRDKPWVEGATGSGVGESVLLTLDKPAKVRRIGIVNGFARSEELYRANGRVSSFRVSVNGGGEFGVTIPDERLEREMFYFDLPADSGLVKTIQLKIDSVYPGGQFDDTAISELELVIPLDKPPRIQPAR